MINREKVVEPIRKMILESMTKQGPSALAISIVTDEGVLWTESFGHLDKNREKTVNDGTLFSIQSTTKFVNAVAFMLAVQEGIIQLDDKLINYFPEFKVKSRWDSDEYKKITFRHLLSHQSGLPQMTRIGSCCDNSPHTFEEHIHSIIDTWLQYPVGSRFNYSNIGMDLVSYCMAIASGVPFPQFVRERLADPLGISIVYSSVEAKKNPNRVIGYEHPETPIPIGTAHAYGCGGIWMNISDLAVLTQFLLNRGNHDGTQILNPELFEMIMTPQFEGDEGFSYGLGTFLIQGGNVRIVQHAGGGFGYGSMLSIALDHGVGAVIEINQEDVGLVTKLAHEAIDLVLKEKGIERKMPSKEDFISGSKKMVQIETLRSYEGFYTGVWSTVKVYLKGENLFVDAAGHTTELIPYNETIFTSHGFPSMVQFSMKGKEVNKLTLLTSSVGPVDLFYQRPIIKPKEITVKKEWESLEGLYRMSYYGIHLWHLAVKIVDGRLVHRTFGGSENLYPLGDEPDTFITEGGEIIEFGEDHLRMSNRFVTRVEDPVRDVQDALESGKPNPMLSDWVLKQEIGHLKFLGWKDEADTIQNTFNEIYGHKK